jgi:mannose-6-phosphate isomerase
MARRLTPKFVERIWGSTQLEPLYPRPGIKNGPTQKIGEVWLEADGLRLPLLVKFIFSTEKLSVQVHPDDAYAALHHNSPGKTEMWHVVAAAPGAQIAAGFREPISTRQFREAAVSGEIEQLLEWRDARPSDTFFLPAGTVHAIGPGLVMCEIQQQSDLTYRIYDYNRGRELHLDQALEVSHLEPFDPRVEATEGILVACDHFTTSLVKVKRTAELPGHAGQFVVVVRGRGRVAGEAGAAGDAWFAESGPIPLEGDMEVLSVHAP